MEFTFTMLALNIYVKNMINNFIEYEIKYSSKFTIIVIIIIYCSCEMVDISKLLSKPN